MNYYREVSKMHGDETCWTFATQKLDGDDDNDNGNFFLPTLKQLSHQKNQHTFPLYLHYTP